MHDRLFGLISLFVALAYIASATNIQTSFLVDPLGPKAFPVLIGSFAALAALVLVLRPGDTPAHTDKQALIRIAITLGVLVIYALTLRPLGFIVPTAFGAAAISFQIRPHWRHSAITGVGLACGLFVIFKFLLGLGLVAWPKFLGL